MPRHARTCLPLAIASLAIPGVAVATDPGERLILFTEADGPVAADVRRRLDGHRAVAEELGVAFETRAVADGAPGEVAITPMLVFQNERGRSIYQGRYSSLDRLRNFVRTSRFVPQEATPLVRRDVPVWTVGRATIATPMKITPLRGETPDDHDAARFRAEATAALATGMGRFTLRERVELGRGDRQFYLDVHPYHDAGILYLSCEIYSQFDCHDPIYSAPGEPLVGFWDDRQSLFEEAGAHLEGAIRRLVIDSPDGDAFVPVPAETPVISWSEAGLDLPASSSSRPDRAPTGAGVPRRWTIDDEASVVLFRFAPPLDSYAGEARTIIGSLRVGTSLPASTGTFEVAISSLTMGEALLDRDLQTDAFFSADRFPVSRFELERIEAEEDRLRWGAQTQVALHGTFSLKGLRIPLTARAMLEPGLDDQGEPRLFMTADWRLSIGPFDLKGPDGPAEARDTVLFLARLTMRPAPADDRSSPENTP